MYKLTILLLCAVIAQYAYTQDIQARGDHDINTESPKDIPEEEEEGSGSHGFGEKSSIPLIEDAETTAYPLAEDSIECPNEICTCSHEQSEGNFKLTVDCSSQDLTELPNGIDKRVTRLLLQKNKLEEVPKDVAEFRELEELNINDNSIKGFAFGSVGELSKLRVLKAANNRLIEFPQELKNGLELSSLQELDLGNNDMRDKLTAEHFTHMEKITFLTIPLSSHELVEDLCHHLGATLKQVCINDCSVEIKECANYVDNSSELLPPPGLEVIQTEPVINNTKEYEEVSNETTDNLEIRNETPESDVSEPTLGQENQDIQGSNGDNKINDPTTNNASTQHESTTISTETTTIGEVPSKNDELNAVDTELRNAVKNAPDTSATSLSNSDLNEIGTENEANVTNNLNITEPPENELTNQQAEEDTDNGVKVGAASIKQGGGIDNSVIALIVAGMVVVVAGVTIKRNWKSITNRFRPRSSPAAGVAETNGKAPEEVPLQDKSIV